MNKLIQIKDKEINDFGNKKINSGNIDKLWWFIFYLF